MRTNKRFFCILLCLFMLNLPFPVYAAETAPEEEPEITQIRIKTAEEFLRFAEKCRLDTYSQNLAVSLDNDIDLTGMAFESIPLFSGTFLGNGHTISGLSLTDSGSAQGLFRYLTNTARIQDLSIRGNIHPGGSRGQVGAIAGCNEGNIVNCSFQGSLSGGEYVGGLVGRNAVTGIIENCNTEGSIHGDHFVGGIAGENCGVIRNCSNQALINTTPQQNSVKIADITLDTLTKSEAINTVTDIGGIAGISSGVIRECKNQNDVGYQHMGYNIGGIAGTQSGYVIDCSNHGSIQGRKEVGGIVGQMEPVSLIEYTRDTLQILQDQLGTMSGLVSKASSNAQANASQIGGHIGVLYAQAQTAKDAVDMLIPNIHNPEFPDRDALLAAQNTLSSAIHAFPRTINNISSSAQATVYGLSRDLQAISGQVSAMGRTISQASENMGGSITDISDQDTEDILTGKVENCINYGSVLADLNVGGIAGAVAMENDLDILEDWERYGEESLNFQSEVRAVILRCENQGTITGKKQNIGGIAGWQPLGLIKDSANTGTVKGTGANYVGGIIGLSSGYIRSCNTKCEIYGNTYVGGIAGSAEIVTNALAQTRILDGSEKLGGILGWAEDADTEEEIPISGNIYLCIDRDYGGIDGISYAGLAESMELDAFLHMENLPEMFQTVTVQFLLPNGKVSKITVTPGDGIHIARIPSVPQKPGYTGVWAGLADANLSSIFFDMTFEPVYTSYRTTIASEQTREDGLPVLLLEGSFTDRASVNLVQSSTTPALTEKEALLEAWTIQATEPGSTVRIHLPAGMDGEKTMVFLCNQAGIWRESTAAQVGQYLVLPLQEGDTGIALVFSKHNPLWDNWILPVMAAACLIVVAFVIKKQRKIQTAT